MIPVAQMQSVEQAIRRIIHSINFSEDVRGFTAVGSFETFTTTAPGFGINTFGGMAVDRSVFRQLLHDTRWVVYAAGWVNLADANPATLGLAYVKDDGTLVMLGTTAVTTSGKVTLGPFDLFGTAGVPAGETVPMVVLTAQKTAGADGSLAAWSVWVRFLASKQ